MLHVVAASSQKRREQRAQVCSIQHDDDDDEYNNNNMSSRSQRVGRALWPRAGFAAPVARSVVACSLLCAVAVAAGAPTGVELVCVGANSRSR